MWIFSQTGFVSVVQHWDKPNILVVRAREKQSLSGLSAALGAPIIATPANDYPYRSEVEKRDFAEWVKQQVATVDYPNYKSKMSQTRGGEFAWALSDVWLAMHQIEERDLDGETPL